MRLLVFSDLHLEHRPLWSLPSAFPPFDVAVVAGDVAGSPADAVATLGAAPGLTGRPVVLICGNHEFYGGVIQQRLREGRAACANTNVRMLDRETLIVGGVRFVAATLWSDYALHDDPITGQVAAMQMMNDHRLIETEVAGSVRRFLPGHALARHQADRAFIEAELARHFAGPTVVVTHHAPHRRSVHPRFAEDAASPSFASDLTDVIARGRPGLWIHGHTHDPFDYIVQATRVVCNPKGYGPTIQFPQKENASFDEALIVEV